MSGIGGLGANDMALKPVRNLQDASAQGPNGSSVTITWNTGALTRVNGILSKKQELIDSEVLRLCSPFVPFRNGALEQSGTTGTVIGSGEVKYIVPYARRQYYRTARTRSYDPRRGGMWFERMKTANKTEILRLINQA
jgi:hypothetical protein|nr:MAG TPA: Minor capsid protein [Caudoviricetes sp.]